jgi:hypothetical protein
VRGEGGAEGLGRRRVATLGVEVEDEAAAAVVPFPVGLLEGGEPEADRVRQREGRPSRPRPGGRVGPLEAAERQVGEALRRQPRHLVGQRDLKGCPADLEERRRGRPPRVQRRAVVAVVVRPEQVERGAVRAVGEADRPDVGVLEVAALPVGPPGPVVEAGQADPGERNANPAAGRIGRDQRIGQAVVAERLQLAGADLVGGVDRARREEPPGPGAEATKAQGEPQLEAVGRGSSSARGPGYGEAPFEGDPAAVDPAPRVRDGEFQLAPGPRPGGHQPARGALLHPAVGAAVAAAAQVATADREGDRERRDGRVQRGEDRQAERPALHWASGIGHGAVSRRWPGGARCGRCRGRRRSRCRRDGT